MVCLIFIITLQVTEYYINLVVFAVETALDLVNCDFVQTTYEIFVSVVAAYAAITLTTSITTRTLVPDM